MMTIVKFLIENGADIYYQDSNGGTPLLELCRNYEEDDLKEIVQLFIKDRANTNTKDKYGNTPLLELCDPCHKTVQIDVIKLLLLDIPNSIPAMTPLLFRVI